MKYHIYALILGFLLDLIFGDPRILYHPICAIGNLISHGEKPFRAAFPKTEKGELAAGVFFCIFVVAVSMAVPFGLLYLARNINFWLYFALLTFWSFQILATKSLKTESMKVYDALKEGDLEKARYAVSMIVGRDTTVLDETGVTKAAVETVAENTSDGVIAPMLYMALGGPVLGMMYKAVNTMDSMVGYRNDKYMDFGRAAARLDDGVNFIPARISGLLMVAVAFLMGFGDRLRGFEQIYSGRRAFRIFLRDRRKHASPNAAHTEAACAGALGVQLAGNARYFGRVVEKPTLGENLRPVVPADILRANRLMLGTAVLCECICLGTIGLLL